MKIKNNKNKLVLNEQDTSHLNKNQLSIHIAENSVSDKGDGLVMFGKSGLVITNDQPQWNGTKYDIASMDISGFGNKLTANHSGKIQDIIGRVIGTRKVSNKKVVIDGIQFAVEENALALFAYNMLVKGYLTDFSIETVGPWPDDDGIYKESSLVGLSAVVVGNNKSAKINEVVANSIKEAQTLGLDTSIVETNFVCYDNNETITQNNSSNKENEETMKYKLIKNSRGFAVTVNFKSESGEMVQVVLPVGQSVSVLSEQSEAVEKQINEATEPKAEAAKVEESTSTNAILTKLNEMTEKQNALEKQLFNNSAQEPTFKKADKAVSAVNELSSLDADEKHQLQITSAWNFLKNGNQEAFKTLNDINKINLQSLQEAGKVKNSMTIADFGNFVISPELLTEIEGHRSNFQPLLSRLSFRETMSTQMAWLKRNGDISMTEVEFCDDDADGNLKPISEYSADINQSNLMELAAVTPICNAATRFLAVDLLGDAAEGFRVDYDRKKAQLFIARLQQAVNTSGNTTVLNTQTGALNPLYSIIDTAGEVAEQIDSGVWIFSTATYYQLLKYRLAAGVSTDAGFDLFTTGENPQFVGSPYIVVPNELMPKLDSGTTRTFTVGGVSVTINQGMFFVDLATFTGRTSGGLQYDLSTEASYEVGDTVKSAFQRNELLLRGSFFRGGAVRDTDKVSGLGAPGVS